MLVGGVGYYGVYKINQGAEDLGGHWLKATTALTQVIEDTEDTRRTLLLGFTMRADATEFQKSKSTFINFRTKWETDFSTFEKYVTSPEGKTNNATLQKSFTTYMADADQVWDLLGQGKDVEARPILTDKSKVSFEQVLKDMEAQMAFQANGGAQAVVNAKATDSTSARLLIIFMVTALIGGAVLAIMLARHISKPLVAVTKVCSISR